jgi:hypothetical protein
MTMTMTVNTTNQLQALLARTDLDSAGLTLLSVIAHHCGTVGSMAGEVTQNGVAVAGFQLVVEESGAPNQADIDLAALSGGSAGSTGSSDCCCGSGSGSAPGTVFRVVKGGYAVFYVASGPAAYAVRLSAPQPKSHGFDSAKLGAGDLFTISPLRPGRYRVTNRETGQHAEVQVLYPDPSGKRARGALEPERVRVSEHGFEKARIVVRGAQGIVFAIETSARIVLELKEPDDGPGGPRTPSHPGAIRPTLLGMSKPKA